MPSYRDIEMKVIEWAQARKIIPNSTPKAQATKTVEEAGELLEAATALKVCSDLAKLFPGLPHRLDFIEYRSAWLDKFKDAAGDTVVTLVNACALTDVDLIDCFVGSYDEIKNRKGTMNEAGVFIKETNQGA